MTRPLCMIGLLLLGACVPRSEPADTLNAVGGQGAEALVGTVRIVGSAPMNVQVVLEPDGGRGVRLVGPLASELQRLAGARVAVRGAIAPSPDPIVDRQIEASGYEILSVNDRPVVMGEIVGVSGEWVRLRTAEGEEVFLSGAPSDFRVGQKVWVQGPRSMAVQSYGTIRP
jgi:hypothetical protein